MHIACGRLPCIVFGLVGYVLFILNLLTFGLTQGPNVAIGFSEQHDTFYPRPDVALTVRIIQGLQRMRKLACLVQEVPHATNLTADFLVVQVYVFDVVVHGLHSL